MRLGQNDLWISRKVQTHMLILEFNKKYDYDCDGEYLLDFQFFLGLLWLYEEFLI